MFANQTNIVIWDEKHHVEHFIRNANFRSGATDFGFIAPTPGKPQLSEASSQAFQTLANLTPFLRSYGFGGGRGSTIAKSRADEVRVIQEADVSGYHAATLWSRSAQAINDWMNENGYVSTPEVEKWADRYTKRGWFLTAFRVVDKAKLNASTGTIRMSFKARQPYNPFYVPSSNIPAAGGSTLQVYFVSVGAYESHIGPHGAPWQAAQWSAPVPETSAQLLAKQVKLSEQDIPTGAQVESFTDPNFPRPAPEDIYFTKMKPAPQPLHAENKRQNPRSAETLLLASPLLLAAFARRRTTV